MDHPFRHPPTADPASHRARLLTRRCQHRWRERLFAPDL